MSVNVLFDSRCVKCQRRKRTNNKLKNENKTKRFKSFFLPYKAAVRIRVGGTQSVCSTCAPSPLFLDINAFEKALIS